MVLVFLLYLAVGALYGVYFIIRGYAKIDPAASSASLPLRLLWFPAATLLWPILVRR